MTSCRRRLFAASLGAVLTACAQPAPGPAGAGRPAVLVREDLSPGFIGFVGPKSQHAPPFLGTPGTNFYCLRSFLDRSTGEVAHQLYVTDSYSGAERGWNSAHDADGRPLQFVHISRDEIACEAGCSYAEEFAATLPESELRTNTDGVAVTFASRSGNEKTIVVSAERITAQLATVDAKRDPAAPIAIFGVTPP